MQLPAADRWQQTDSTGGHMCSCWQRTDAMGGHGCSCMCAAAGSGLTARVGMCAAAAASGLTAHEARLVRCVGEWGAGSMAQPAWQKRAQAEPSHTCRQRMSSSWASKKPFQLPWRSTAFLTVGTWVQRQGGGRSAGCQALAQAGPRAARLGGHNGPRQPPSRWCSRSNSAASWGQAGTAGQQLALTPT